MKILWLTNIVLPQIAEATQSGKKISCGWLTQLADLVAANNDFYVVYPQSNTNNTINGKTDTMTYYGFYESAIPLTQYSEQIESEFKKIIQEVQPDIVHIWGTEYVHSLAMVKAFNNPAKTVISIQGLVSIYAKHFFADLPYKILRRYTFRDFLRKDNIIDQQKKYAIRGKYEIEAIKGVAHTIGRTDWDKAATRIMNPGITYHKCNEILRAPFYERAWDIAKCNRHSVFVSSAAYPIKGFHYVLEAANILKTEFPDIKIRVAGSNITRCDGLKGKLKMTSYAKYIKELIEKYELQNIVEFTGMIDENQMCEEYLKANVFVSAASIENSPNSMGEAMLLGTPVVASDVGGVKSLMNHEEEGLIYQHNATYMMAEYIRDIFVNDKLAVKLSGNARKRAGKTHSVNETLKQYLETYESISNS